MNDLQLSAFLSSQFSSSITYQVEQLPEPARREFMFAYNEEKKDLGIAYILHFLFGAAYAYQGKWIKQIIFWITFFGFFGIGWAINIVRMPSSIKKENQKIANKILRGIYRRYNFKRPKPVRAATDYIAKRAKIVETTLNNAKPRNIKPAYDPVNLSVENLEKGFMVDYDFKTWDVVSEMQFDWERDESERCFKLAADTRSIFLNLRKDNGHLYVIHFDSISLYAIDSRLEAEINLRNKPSNIVRYKDTPYYRESTKSGLLFTIFPTSNASRITIWEYYDDSRENIIRIEKYGKDDFKAFLGKLVSPLDFSEILPNK